MSPSWQRSWCCAVLLAGGAFVVLVAGCRSGGASGVAATPTPDAPAGCAPARAHAPGNTTESIPTANGVRSYILHVPPGYDGAAALPLVLNLHGAGSNKEQQAFYSGFPQKADRERFILLTPDGAGTPRQWNFLGLASGADDLGFLRAILDRSEASLCIDTSRVYATGISSGGAMSISLGCSLPERITAVAPVAALYLPPGCATTRPIPLIEFHGTDDPIVPFHGGKVGGIPSPDVEQAAAAWAKGDGCDANDRVSQVSEHVKLEAYGGCRGGVTVELYVVDGGGHTWPGARADVTLLGATTHEISGTDLIWQFFASQPILTR